MPRLSADGRGTVPFNVAESQSVEVKVEDAFVTGQTITREAGLCVLQQTCN